jgi:hypothetical protein
MYPFVLTLHSLLRWLVLVFGLLACARALTGWTGGRPWTRPDERAGLFYMISLDVQILIGLLLYFALSSFGAIVFQDFGAAMRTPQLRFWAVEHVTMMLLAGVLAHVGRVMARKAPTDAARHRRVAICFALSLLLLLLGIPWPGTANARPLFRLG